MYRITPWFTRLDWLNWLNNFVPEGGFHLNRYSSSCYFAIEVVIESIATSASSDGGRRRAWKRMSRRVFEDKPRSGGGMGTTVGSS